MSPGHSPGWDPALRLPAFLRIRLCRVLVASGVLPCDGQRGKGPRGSHGPQGLHPVGSGDPAPAKAEGDTPRSHTANPPSLRRRRDRGVRGGDDAELRARLCAEGPGPAAPGPRLRGGVCPSLEPAAHGHRDRTWGRSRAAPVTRTTSCPVPAWTPDPGLQVNEVPEVTKVVGHRSRGAWTTSAASPTTPEDTAEPGVQKDRGRTETGLRSAPARARPHSPTAANLAVDLAVSRLAVRPDENH